MSITQPYQPPARSVHQAVEPMPARRADDADDPDDGPAADPDDALHRLCEAWADWCRAGNLHGLSAPAESTLVSLPDHPRRRRGDIRVPPVRQIVSFHLAVISQPAGGLDRRVFEAHYLERARNIKSAAARLGISRPHWYRLMQDFRARVHSVAQQIEMHNSAWEGAVHGAGTRGASAEAGRVAAALPV